jgi:hypothetical protein
MLSVDRHWLALVWRVLFPLLEQVRLLTSTASREREKHPNNPNFLMHHSRDTAEKQWAETSVLTLAGVTRVFNSKLAELVKLSNDEFHRMWLFLLNVIQSLALSRNSEIAQAALRGFHELLGNHNYFSSASSFISSSNTAAQTVAAAAAAASAVTTINNPSSISASQTNGLNGSFKKKDAIESGSPQTGKGGALNGSLSAQSTSTVSPAKTFEIAEWLAAWKTWLDIGNNLLNSANSATDVMTIYSWPPPGQTFLTCYVDLVSVIVDRLAPAGKFTPKDFENFSLIIDKLLAVPVLSNDYSSFILMQTESNLTPLQNSCLNTIKNYIKLFKTPDASFQNQFITLVFHRLLAFVLFACYTNNNQMQNHLNHSSSPGVNSVEQPQRSGNLKLNDIVAINCVLFGEKALTLTTNLYEETCSNEAVIENLILKTIIQVSFYESARFLLTTFAKYLNFNFFRLYTFLFR